MASADGNRIFRLLRVTCADCKKYRETRGCTVISVFADNAPRDDLAEAKKLHLEIGFQKFYQARLEEENADFFYTIENEDYLK